MNMHPMVSSLLLNQLKSYDSVRNDENEDWIRYQLFNAIELEKEIITRGNGMQLIVRCMLHFGADFVYPCLENLAVDISVMRDNLRTLYYSSNGKQGRLLRRCLSEIRRRSTVLGRSYKFRIFRASDGVFKSKIRLRVKSRKNLAHKYYY